MTKDGDSIVEDWQNDEAMWRSCGDIAGANRYSDNEQYLIDRSSALRDLFG